jgi:PKD repeat protein
MDVRITQSTDDVEENLAGSMYFDSSDLELGNDPEYNGDQTVGLRFQNVNIPKGATITAVFLEFETDETGSSPTTVTIAAEAVNNAPAFTSSNYNLTGRTLTLASVGWNIPVWDTINQKHRSPDLSTVMQEVVDRGGWSANNSLVFIISGSGTRTAESYDGEPTAAPLLHVEYTTDGGANTGPTAAFTYNCMDLVCDFTDGSTDSDGSVTAWAWDFGDGSSANTVNSSYIYAVAGTYNVSLAVTDNDGDSDSITHSVTAIAPSLSPAAPTNLTASVQSSGRGKKKVVTGVQLNWSDNSSNEDVFVIEHCEETGKGKNKNCNFTEFALVKENITSFSDDPGSGRHKYRVKARNAQGDSAYTNEVKI